jgi:fatty-acid desaturase
VSGNQMNVDIPVSVREHTDVRTWWVDWFNVFGMISYHALAALAFTPWFFNWTGVVLAIAGHYSIGLLGINLCYHRLLSHRGFRCPKWLEHSFVVLGVCCSQDSPAYWVATHRRHHQYTDEERDPHTPAAGFIWAHMGWFAFKNDAIERHTVSQRYAKDILRDPFYAWLERYWLSFIFIAWILFFTVGFAGGKLSGMTTTDALMVGITTLLWGVVVRTVLTWHITWAINSVSHSWGYRNYDTEEGSRNNFVLAILAHGEGWHNNHHADPNSAMHGHLRWEIDPVFWVIRLLAALGLAKDIVMPAAIRRRQPELRGALALPSRAGYGEPEQLPAGLGIYLPPDGLA